MKYLDYSFLHFFFFQVSLIIQPYSGVCFSVYLCKSVKVKEEVQGKFIKAVRQIFLIFVMAEHVKYPSGKIACVVCIYIYIYEYLCDHACMTS